MVKSRLAAITPRRPGLCHGIASVPDLTVCRTPGHRQRQKVITTTSPTVLLRTQGKRSFAWSRVSRLDPSAEPPGAAVRAAQDEPLTASGAVGR